MTGVQTCALPSLLTRREVVNMLKISLVTLHDWTNKGVLKAYKVGNRVYYKADEVRASLVQKWGLQ